MALPPLLFHLPLHDMQELLRAYGLNHDEALSHLRAVLERYGQAYEQARIRCVSTEANGIWHNALCVIKIHPSGIQGDKEASRRYGKAHLLEQWVKPEDLLAIFDQIQKGVIKVDGEDVSLGAHTRFDEWEFLPSNNDYSSYPGYVFRTPHVVQVPGFPHHEPLLSYDLPFYPNPYFAIKEWSEIKKFYVLDDARIGTLQVFLPQCRSFFQNLERDGNILHIGITGSGAPDLRVKGAWEYEDGCSPFEAPVTGSEIAIGIPDDVQGFEVYLIGADGTIYDFHRETRLWVLGQERALRDLPRQGTDQGGVQSALQHGEGESVEFKPFIKKGDIKHREIVNTVIAFSNTKSGVILIGVNDQCIVVGIENDIAKQAHQNNKCTQGEELSSYIGWLKQSIVGELNRSLDLKISPIEVEGHTVVLINVPEGDHKPYANVRTNAIYIRRGANNVLPHPDHELPQLYKSSSERQAMPWEQ